MTNQKKITNFNLIEIIKIFFFVISSISLILITINLFYIADWAKYQTICIEEESINTTIPWSVRKCNGRSKVYQVK